MKTLFVILCVCIGTALTGAWAGALHPVDLRCEYVVNPLGIDILQPRLSWKLQPGRRSSRGLAQSAYQVLVASSARQLESDAGDLWDSGKIDSDQNIHVIYSGKPLVARQRCYWKVRVWDAGGDASGYSATGQWEMGLLSRSDWSGQWIGRTTDIEERPAPMFRRTFELPARVKQARVYICGLGYHEVYLNGQRLGRDRLDPGYTRYDKRVLYRTYDATDHLRKGPNAIGVILGHGWFNVQTHAVWDFHKAPWRSAPKMLVTIEAESVDGQRSVLGSDAAWQCATGPIVFNSIYGGETYDARLERPGWSEPGYAESGWTPAKAVLAPNGRLAAQHMPGIQSFESFKPVKIAEPKPGLFVLDFGQNLAGCAELKVRGPAGTKVVMNYGERLSPDGTLDCKDIEQHVVRANPTQPFQTDTYILKGGRDESWRSRFVYHGFQYVQMSGFPGKPTPENVRAVFMHSAVPKVGRFECSNPLFNHICRAAYFAYLSNLQGIPTDCPHREKNGWTGDAHLAAEQAIYTFDPAPVYTKWIQDLADEQRASGELPGIVPTSGWGYKWGNGPAWDSAFLLIPYYLYEYYGDTRILTQHYAEMKRYVDYLTTTKAKDGIVSSGLNDWAPYKTQTPADITSTAYYYRDAQIVALAAELLGNSAEAAHYRDLARNIKKSFNQTFHQPEKGLYGNGSQTALSCALYQGLAESEHVGNVLSNLVALVEQRNGHIDTGILGAKYLLNALRDYGRADVAYRIAAQKEQPGWGWWLEQGATTLWEQWNGTESRNHIMFGDIVAWFYKTLAGIMPDPQAPGFKHFIIKPHPVGGLTYAKGEYESIRGRILSDWKLVDGEFRLQIEVPVNTRATVWIPVAHRDTVRESGSVLSKAAGLKWLRQEPGWTVLEAGSGRYRFSGPLAD